MKPKCLEKRVNPRGKVGEGRLQPNLVPNLNKKKKKKKKKKRRERVLFFHSWAVRSFSGRNGKNHSMFRVVKTSKAVKRGSFSKTPRKTLRKGLFSQKFVIHCLGSFRRIGTQLGARAPPGVNYIQVPIDILP